MIREYTLDELYKEIFDQNMYDFKLKYGKDDCNSYYFKGFHYFSPSNFNEIGRHNFLLYKLNKEIVGVLKYGYYDDYGSSPLYCAIEYIDIRVDYKNKGLAKQLIEYFCKSEIGTDLIKISSLSEEGKKCKLDQIITTKALRYGRKTIN